MPKFEPFEDTQMADNSSEKVPCVLCVHVEASTISIYHFDEFLGTISLSRNDNTNGSWSINGHKIQ